MTNEQRHEYITAAQMELDRYGNVSIACGEHAEIGEVITSWERADSYLGKVVVIGECTRAEHFRRTLELLGAPNEPLGPEFRYFYLVIAE